MKVKLTLLLLLFLNWSVREGNAHIVSSFIIWEKRCYFLIQWPLWFCIPFNLQIKNKILHKRFIRFKITILDKTKMFLSLQEAPGIWKTLSLKPTFPERQRSKWLTQETDSMISQLRLYPETTQMQAWVCICNIDTCACFMKKLSSLKS